MKDNYISRWFREFWDIFTHELKSIFSDGGVLIIFFVAGFGYPLLYNFVYRNGVLEDTPIAVVDNADCSESRRFVREIDATRELEVAYRCADMEEAQKLMADRKVNGIVYFPSDFGKKIAAMETAKLSVYADMSSFLYYKNLLMGSEFVMLHEIGKIQVERYSAAGYTGQETSQLIKAIPYQENLPYNRTFSYSVFLISAILMLIVQQVMFYGMSMLAGTAREESRSFATLPEHLHGLGVGRVVFGRGAAYWLLFMGIGIYVGCIVPALFGIPQRGSYRDILAMLAFFVTDCVFFSMTWSTMITRRETVFVLLLFMSPICVFLTGFSWPTTAIPGFWKVFSYIFPSTFGCQAFINLNTAGASLQTASYQMIVMTIQSAIYFFLACTAIYVENHVLKRKMLSTSSES